jgi:dynactin complex subunit
MSAMELSVGLHVAVTAGRGVIRWIGKDPEFSSGHWVGVELCVLRVIKLGDY